MCPFLLLLWVLGATPVFSIFEGTCLKKEPPPGVLVLSPGSNLVLSCDGDVKVDGATVKVTKHTSNDRNTSSETQTGNFALLRTHMKVIKDESQEKGAQSAGNTSSLTSSWFLTPTHTPLNGDDMDGSKKARGVKEKFKWKWNGRTVGKGLWDWEGFTSARRGTQLSVALVQLNDSGNYTCQHRGRTIFSLKVIVADTPEVPTLSCSKRSPSSKIRCDWKPQKPLALHPNCSLLVSKRPSDRFHRIQCSFSSQWSRCWCVLEHNENELRKPHMAYLCVTNMAGNATSAILSFTPLDILKPDPPSSLSVRQDVRQERRMFVSWTFPTSWKSQDSYYALVYELRYQPVDSSSASMQLKSIKGRRSFTINDALPGVQYMIQLRTKEEFDGLWSDWSATVYGSSWIDSRTQETIPFLNDELLNITFPEDDGSGIDEPLPAVPKMSVSPVRASHHILWVSCTFAVFAVILAAFVFRHKEKILAKVHSLSVKRQYKGPVQPKAPVPAAPEGRALVTLNLPCDKDEAPAGEKEDEVEENIAEMEKSKAIHFDNANYFLVQNE
nr:interleukin-6 receptor subunit alpha-like [Nerophis lumbriciformis]